MTSTVKEWCRWRRLAPARRALSLLFCIVLVTPCLGAELLDGDWRLVWDTTLGYGLQWRVQGRDTRFIAPNQFAELLNPTQQGTAFSSNADDGNLNYDTGLTSNVIDLTTELALQHKNWFGAFVRARAFYDIENDGAERDRFDYPRAIETGRDVSVELSGAALDGVGSGAELLDAYAWFDWDLGRVPFEFRLGDQVLSWGESTFIPGGINTINPVDVAQLRSPGSELRQALLPVGLAWLSFAPSKNTSVELYYQYDWGNTELDPVGTFFSTTDIVGGGGRKFQLGFGADAAPDLGSCFFDTPTLSCDVLPTDPNVDGNDFHEDFLAVIRGPDRAPGDGGEYGAAFRVVASRLNETEFGFYFINYHSRLPVLSGTTGTARAVATARNAFRFFARVPGITPTEARALALDVYVPATSYFADYPEDIELYGFSVSSAIGRTAIRGEVSRRKDAPLQVDDVELLLAVLSPVTFNPAFKENQLGAFGPSEEITGFIRRETTQAQATVTRILGPLLGADTSVVVGEAAFFKVHDMPAKDTLRLEGPATFTSGNPLQATSPNPMNPSFPLGGSHQGKPAEPASAFPDASSWGYRLAGRLEYDNAIGPINLLPRFSWQHDVDGISPGPGGLFIDGRQALTLGVSGTYQSSWEADISWTGFSGADRRNLLADRDFVSASIKYSF